MLHSVGVNGQLGCMGHLAYLTEYETDHASIKKSSPPFRESSCVVIILSLLPRHQLVSNDNSNQEYGGGGPSLGLPP